MLAYVYVCACMRVYVHVHMYVYVHVYVCVNVFIHIYIHAHVGEVGFFPACSWLVLVAGVRGYVLAGVEIGVLSCIFLYFCGC